MSMVENAGNWNELVREQNVAKTGLFLDRLRLFHPEREVAAYVPVVEVTAPELAPTIPPAPIVITNVPINVRALNPVATIARSACAHFGMTLAALLSERRDAESVRARHVVMYVSKTLTTLSFPSIARHMGGMDHTSIMNGVRKITARIATDQALSDDVAAVRELAIAADPALGALV